MKNKYFLALLQNRITFVASIAFVKTFLNLFIYKQYGFYRDELYFVACGNHLAWGYVDHPPFVPFIAKISQLLFGDSLYGLRFIPTLFGVFTVWLLHKIIKHLGGSFFAEALTLIAFLIAPIYLRGNALLHIAAFDVFFWLACFYLLMLLIDKPSTNRYLIFGGLLGIAFLIKYNILFFIIALLLSLIFSKQRSFFQEKGFYLSFIIALLIALPNIIWQINHHFPSLEFLFNLNTTVMKHIALSEFLWGQVFYLHPLNFPLWLCGIYYFLFDQKGKTYRLLGLIYLILLSIFLSTKSKVYYLAPAYPILLVGGAMFFEKIITKRYLKIITLSLLVSTGIILAPFGIPLLSTDKYQIYKDTFTKFFPSQEDLLHRASLGYYNMLRWEELAKNVSKIYHSLPIADQEKCTIITSFYGEAAALEFYQKKYDLPPVICPNHSYFFWGTKKATGEVMLVVNANLEGLQDLFQSVEPVYNTQNTETKWFASELPIYICRNINIPLEILWPKIKIFVIDKYSNQLQNVINR